MLQSKGWMEASDQDLVVRVRDGERDAFRVLVDRYSRSVFRLGYRMTATEQDAEDVVQETFLRAYKQLHRYESRSSFGTWIYRIASNYALDLLRARERRQEMALEPLNGSGERFDPPAETASPEGLGLRRPVADRLGTRDARIEPAGAGRFLAAAF